MPFPPAHMLVGAGMAEAARAAMDRPPPRRRAWIAAALLACAADGDIILGIMLGKGGAYHGTFTHSVFAAVVVGLMAWAVWGWRWGVIGGLGYGSHLLVDLLDDSGPTNLMLGWPFSGARPYSLGRLFPKITVEGDGPVDTAMNILRDADELWKLVLQTLLGAAFFAALLLLAAVIRRARSRAASS